MDQKGGSGVLADKHTLVEQILLENLIKGLASDDLL
jgi:hypothetical protein